MEPVTNLFNNPANKTEAVCMINEALEYAVDTAQRSVLFMDVMRKRGNTYIEHLQQGQPPVLTFDYEMIMDGRKLEKPVNYSLVRIIDKRDHLHPAVSVNDRRHHYNDSPKRQISAASSTERPIVIIDPRAGHGPGIGGSKRDSEIGIALSEGRPVYFILFYTKPEPGQTLADVKNAEIKFIEEVVRRHPDSPPPSIIGNCQAGWAAAIVASDRPDIAGPLVLNGAPLSYWAGIEGTNPMRYRGGLFGGVWLNSLLSDFGNGLFDGANLVANMEDLNPANRYWTKQYNLYSKIDTEEERYLNFEKWWGGFFLLTSE
jgi:pimeloyl-ACP methyl ester carboxylesterase